MPRLHLPPGPTRRHPGEFILAIRRDPLGFFGRVARDHGDIAHLRVGTQHVFLLGHPELVKDLLVTQQKNFTKGRGLERARLLLGNGLLTSEGDDHLRQRRLVQPAFHRDRIAGYAAVMSAFADRHAARWTDGETRDIGREMMDLTLGIAAKTLFDADVEGETAEIGEALTTVLGLFNFAVLPFSELIERLPVGPGARFRRARARLDATIYRIIEERRERADDRGDLLSMLLVAQDAEGDGGGLTDTQLRDEVMTLLLAGHETTSNLLTWTWYLLAGHPEVVERLESELHGALAGRAPTAADLPALPYARMVLSEAMRLYPPAWILGRRAIAPCTIGGFDVPARAIVLASQFIVHRDPRFWPEPERFDPERWRATPAGEVRPKFAYFPFGAGTRQCIGEGFAWTEATLLLAAIAQRWRMHLAAGHRVELQPVITLRPKHGVRVTLERRR